MSKWQLRFRTKKSNYIKSNDYKPPLTEIVAKALIN